MLAACTAGINNASEKAMTMSCGYFMMDSLCVRLWRDR